MERKKEEDKTPSQDDDYLSVTLCSSSDFVYIIKATFVAIAINRIRIIEIFQNMNPQHYLLLILQLIQRSVSDINIRYLLFVQHEYHVRVSQIGLFGRIVFHKQII
jgi:hypothetical protein